MESLHARHDQMVEWSLPISDYVSALCVQLECNRVALLPVGPSTTAATIVVIVVTAIIIVVGNSTTI